MKIGILKGGLGLAVIELINNSDIRDVKIKTFGYDDQFIKHGSIEEIEELNGLNANKIIQDIEVNIKK